MGSCSSRSTESGLIPDQEVEPEHSVQTETQATDSAMSERSDFNHFLEANNCMLVMAKERYERCDELQRSYREIKTKRSTDGRERKAKAKVCDTVLMLQNLPFMR